jgi:hypothetical protein
MLGETPRGVRAVNLLGRDAVISVKTVSVHISHILRTLGAPNRLEAAATIRRLAPAPLAQSEHE